MRKKRFGRKIATLIRTYCDQLEETKTTLVLLFFLHGVRPVQFCNSIRCDQIYRASVARTFLVQG